MRRFPAGAVCSGWNCDRLRHRFALYLALRAGHHLLKHRGGVGSRAPFGARCLYASLLLNVTTFGDGAGGRCAAALPGTLLRALRAPSFCTGGLSALSNMFAALLAKPLRAFTPR